ncbi:MAG TPA: hypothetical protein VLI54_02435 [Bacillota bacterium]|nr:hypothetical protein [Bacillota bacterium]
MTISMQPVGTAPVINEVGPILVYAAGFVIALGGASAAAVAVCGWGHVDLTQVDFWKAVIKIQCK